jgi:hypothetical protein
LEQKNEIFILVGNDRTEMESSANESRGAGLPLHSVRKIGKEETAGQRVKKSSCMWHAGT